MFLTHHQALITGGEIDAATFNLDVAGDFDYIA